MRAILFVVILAAPAIAQAPRVWLDQHQPPLSAERRDMASNILLTGIIIPVDWSALEETQGSPDFTTLHELLDVWEGARATAQASDPNLADLEYILRFAPYYCPCWVIDPTDPNAVTVMTRDPSVNFNTTLCGPQPTNQPIQLRLGDCGRVHATNPRAAVWRGAASLDGAMSSCKRRSGRRKSPRLPASPPRLGAFRASG